MPHVCPQRGGYVIDTTPPLDDPTHLPVRPCIALTPTRPTRPTPTQRRLLVRLAERLPFRPTLLAHAGHEVLVHQHRLPRCHDSIMRSASHPECPNAEWGPECPNGVRLTFCALQSKVQNVSLTPDWQSTKRKPDPGLERLPFRPTLLAHAGHEVLVHQHRLPRCHDSIMRSASHPVLQPGSLLGGERSTRAEWPLSPIPNGSRMGSGLRFVLCKAKYKT